MEGLFLFENGMRLDVTFIKPFEFKEWTLNKVKVIQDISGKVKSKYAQTKNILEKQSKPKWNDAEGAYLDWFFWMFRQIYCYIMQAELKPYKRFDKLDSAQSSIKSVRDKLINMIVYLYGKKEYIDSIDKNMSSELEKTYTSLNTQEMLLATRKLAEIYEVLGKEYADKNKLIFPGNKLITMKQLFDEFDQLYKEITARRY